MQPCEASITGSVLGVVHRKLWKVLGNVVQKKQKSVPTIIAINKWDLGTRVHTKKFIVLRLQSEM